MIFHILYLGLKPEVYHWKVKTHDVIIDKIIVIMTLNFDAN